MKLTTPPVPSLHRHRGLGNSLQRSSSRGLSAHLLAARRCYPTAADSLGSLTVGMTHRVVTSWDQATGVASIYDQRFNLE